MVWYACSEPLKPYHEFHWSGPLSDKVCFLVENFIFSLVLARGVYLNFIQRMHLPVYENFWQH